MGRVSHERPLTDGTLARPRTGANLGLTNMIDESGAAISLPGPLPPTGGHGSTAAAADGGDQSGSRWRRWDPHLHAPGTLLNDQFGGDWEGYLTALEAARPTVEVLGVTDYCSLGCYRELRRQHLSGRLPGVRLLFPNVELRLDVATEKKQPVNVHLLFSPEQPDHEEQIDRLLAELAFEYGGRKFRCTPIDLAALGRAHNPAQRDGAAAQREGTNQFKVGFSQLRDLFRGDVWAQRNCLVAVSGGSNDGTAGVQKDASFAAWREEVERLAHVIFSPNAGTRDYWLGRHPARPVAALERTYGGCKPCLHGSDAHYVSRAANPDDGRYCWVKGDPTFESLRQATLEPAERVFIGREPPDRHDARMCIAQVATSLTPWLSGRPVPLNPGLVAIIGSRGSGKTALADMLAVGAGVSSPHSVDGSFLSRASRPVNHLRNGAVELAWGDGARTARRLCRAEEDAAGDGEELVQYLSQQFVEQLCSAEGLAVQLRGEIERVIFEATSPTERFDADTFDQLADIHLGPIRQQRAGLREAIQAVSTQILEEDTLQQRVDPVEKDISQLTSRAAKAKDEMLALTPSGKAERAKRLAELEAAVTAAAVAVDKRKRVLVRLLDLKKEVARLSAVALPQLQAKLQSEYHEVGLSQDGWADFLPRFSGDPDGVIGRRIAQVEASIRTLTAADAERPVDRAAAPLSGWPLDVLVSERDAVKAEVGIDAQKQRRYADLQRALERDERTLQRLRTELEVAKGAAGRRQGHAERRRALYQEVFATYLEEQAVLARLYGPLQQHLEGAEGSLSRLRFSVYREVDLEAWVEAGECLFDLRKDLRLRGHGGLLREADDRLHAAWKFGDAQKVAAAMQGFIQDLHPDIRKSMPSTVSPERATEWMQQVAGWLYSTDHIAMRYGVTYDGVAIEHLSPGTRGIVLLLLYLVIDRHDVRPLIIDQPEENLDPRSVFVELVPHFREARKRRQVVIVTHNANLVVNTDADQVIVATSEPQVGPGLPKVSYRSGSLENPDIRRAVCDILEGGERAFRDRERRYRMSPEHGEHR